MLKSFRKTFRVSSGQGSASQTEVLRRRPSFGIRSSGILVTWPVHLSCASFNRVRSLCISALFRTSVSGILSCHLLIFKSFLRQLKTFGMALVHCPGLTQSREKDILPCTRLSAYKKSNMYFLHS